jgi:RNA polymerase sigma factor (sigma-70 family)
MELSDLVHAAADGDGAAWNEIVDRFQGLVWATTRAHRLTHADAADVAQTTWLRLVESLDRIRDPERLGAWLATTARRECLRHIRLRGREFLSEDTDVFEAPADDSLPELALLTSERDSALWRAFVRLSERCQALLRLLVSSEEPSYQEIGAALGMPVGAIGPTRMRCLEKLRGNLEFGSTYQGEMA